MRAVLLSVRHLLSAALSLAPSVAQAQDGPHHHPATPPRVTLTAGQFVPMNAAVGVVLFRQ